MTNSVKLSMHGFLAAYSTKRLDGTGFIKYDARNMIMVLTLYTNSLNFDCVCGFNVLFVFLSSILSISVRYEYFKNFYYKLVSDMTIARLKSLTGT
jgi:hypothetical protein